MCLTLVNSMRSQGWEVVDANFDDIAESSETLNRPAMQRFLDEIAHQRIDRVIVTRLDRISRRLQDTCEFLCPDCGRRLSVSSKSRQRKSGATILFSDYCCRSTSSGRPPCLGVRFTATLLEDDVVKAIKLLSESNAELAKHWNKLDLREQRLLVPRIVESVSIDDVSETITVKLKSDALEFLD